MRHELPAVSTKVSHPLGSSAAPQGEGGGQPTGIQRTTGEAKSRKRIEGVEGIWIKVRAMMMKITMMAVRETRVSLPPGKTKILPSSKPQADDKDNN